MASIVLGIGTSHGSMLSMPPARWDALARADKKDAALAYRGAIYSWDELAALRGGALANRNLPGAWCMQWARCQAGLDALVAKLHRAAPDALLIVGDDGAAEAAAGPPAPGLAALVETCARNRRFPIALDRGGGFAMRRLLGHRPVPLVRLRFDLSAPGCDAQRCFAFGTGIGHALRGWNGELRVAVIASGGLSHPVIDEELDRRLLDGFVSGDPAHVMREPEAMFRAGAAEIKNWIVAAGALDHTGLEMELVDYVPCVRTKAGTGEAMGFAVWS